MKICWRGDRYGGSHEARVVSYIRFNLIRYDSEHDARPRDRTRRGSSLLQAKLPPSYPASRHGFSLK